MDDLKAIVFDIDGVILDHQIGNNYLWLRNIKKDFNVSPDVIKKLHNDVESWKFLSLGKIKLIDYLNDFLKKENISNISGAELVQYFVKNDDNIRNYMIKEIDILRNKHKYQICIGTHQEPNKGEYLWNNKELKNHFDYFFTSYNVGFLKTDDGFYEKISNILKLKNEEILLIDDKKKNVDRAISCGWNGYLYTTFDDIKNNLFSSL